LKTVGSRTAGSVAAAAIRSNSASSACHTIGEGKRGIFGQYSSTRYAGPQVPHTFARADKLHGVIHIVVGPPQRLNTIRFIEAHRL
jgi:hypothetical protein